MEAKRVSVLDGGLNPGASLKRIAGVIGKSVEVRMPDMDAWLPATVLDVRVVFGGPQVQVKFDVGGGESWYPCARVCWPLGEEAK